MVVSLITLTGGATRLYGCHIDHFLRGGATRLYGSYIYHFLSGGATRLYGCLVDYSNRRCHKALWFLHHITQDSYLFPSHPIPLFYCYHPPPPPPPLQSFPIHIFNGFWSINTDHGIIAKYYTSIYFLESNCLFSYAWVRSRPNLLWTHSSCSSNLLCESEDTCTAQSSDLWCRSSLSSENRPWLDAT